MKITPFTYPQAILGVHDFLLSKEYNRSLIQSCWNAILSCTVCAYQLAEARDYSF